MLDVKTRANEIEFFNIIVDESPIIPYEIYRRYVAGSPKGSMTISGDTIGTKFQQDTKFIVLKIIRTHIQRWRTSFFRNSISYRSWQIWKGNRIPCFQSCTKHLAIALLETDKSTE